MERVGEMEMTEREAWLRLAFVGLPAGRCNAALEKWQSPAALLGAAHEGRDSELLSTQGITPTTVERLREAATRDIEKALSAMSTHNIRVLLRDDEDYPQALRAIPDPPPYLFVRGTIEARDEVAVAIVGTRHTTEYGRGLASQFARDLAARGVTVVSGLARGVDTWAHKGALEAGGRTFAVCGCGLDVVYPSENKNLMLDIVQQGAAFSEFAPTVHPEAWHFPARNRIISGLSAGVIVIEAGERSGALITSDFAMEQGRDVFAVPGNVHKVQSKGPHALIKQGATLVESADDVLEALNQRALPFDVSTHKKEKQRAEAPKVRADLSADENRVYLALETEPRHVDDVASAAQMSAAQANALLVMLELKGAARRAVGGLFSRVD
jgi:DNA processing protein